MKAGLVGSFYYPTSCNRPEVIAETNLKAESLRREKKSIDKMSSANKEMLQTKMS